MIIELSPDAEAQLQALVKTGQYESVEAFIERAISDAYAETEAFAEMVRVKLAESQRAYDEGRVVKMPEGGVDELLRRYRDGSLALEP